MRLYLFLLILLLTNCVQGYDSKLIRENLFHTNDKRMNLSDTTKKLAYSTEMTFDEFKIYIVEYVEKNSYPDISE